MENLSKQQMKSIIGGVVVATCGIKCSDNQFHMVDCGKDDCETTKENAVNCTSGTKINKTTDPCKETIEM